MPRCSAHRSNGDACRAHAVRGAAVCSAHGGLAPQVRAAARRRVVEAEVRRKLAELEVKPIGDPIQTLDELAAKVVALVDLMAVRVAEIEDQPEAKPEAVRAEWKAFTDALDRARLFLRDLAALGLDERRVRISERMGEQVEAVLRAVVVAVFVLLRERLGGDVAALLDEVERREVPGIVRAELLAAVQREGGRG